MKKLLSLALVAVMVLSSVVTCFAVSDDAVPTRTNPGVEDYDNNPEDYVVDFRLSDATLGKGDFTSVDYDGSITVPKSVNTEPTITVSDAEITVGDATADFTVTVENNPGLYCMLGFVAYQAPMALTAVTCGEIFGKFYDGGPLAEGNEYQLNKTVKIFKDYSNIFKRSFEAAGTPDDYIATRIFPNENAYIDVNNTANGTYITFSLDTSKLTPGTYDISFVLDLANTINIDGEEVSFNTVNGTLTVLECAHDWKLVSTDPADCTNDAVEHYECSKCGATDTKTVADSALGHDSQITNVEPATCTTPEITTYICSRCGTYTEETADALGHDVTDVITAPTCEEKGYTTYTCSRCGSVEKRDFVDALGHDMWEVNRIPAACTETGRVDYECSRCDAKDFKVLEALGHDYKAVITAPTCTEKGFTTHTCTRCGDSYTDAEVEALGHDMREVNRIPATCTETGRVDYECSRCDAKDFKVLEALGHDYKDVVTAPTCTEKGFTTHTCTRCADSYTDTEIPALGHDYKDAVTDPTCTEKSFTTHTCVRCGDSHTDTEVDALGHDYETVVTAPTCTEKGFTTHACTRCADSYTDTEAPALGHDMKEVNRIPAACAETGRVDYKCSRCDATDSEVLEALGHKGGTATCKDKAVCSVCGQPYGDLAAHVYNKQAKTAEALKSDGTCQEKAVYYYSCSVCDSVEYNDAHTFEGEKDPSNHVGCISVSGTVTSFGSNNDPVTVQLIRSGASEPAYETVVSSNTAPYSIYCLMPGTYTLKAVKAGYISEEYTLTVGDESVKQNVSLYLESPSDVLGDVNVDGLVTLKDILLLRKVVAGVATLPDSYIACADVTGDGYVTLKDILLLRKVVAGVATL